MRVVEITRTYLGRWHAKSGCRKCPACKRALRPGQQAIHLKLLAKAFADTDIHIHVACIRKAIADVPEDDVEPTNPAAAHAKIRREAMAAAASQRAA